MNLNYMREHILDDDDNFSNISRISCGLQNSLNSTCNSDSECGGPISVRSMIQHYNNQFKKSEARQIYKRNTYKIDSPKRYHPQSQHLLVATRSSYCGLNNYGTEMQTEDDQHNQNQVASSCCKNCTACAYCRNGSRKNSTNTKLLSSTSASFSVVQPNDNNNTKTLNSDYSIHHNGSSGSATTSNNKINAKDTSILAVENCSNIGCGMDADAGISAGDDFDSSSGLAQKHSSQVALLQKKNNHLLATDDAETINVRQKPPIETSYQSKTTISKTSSGVRIIIDIFFDQERTVANASDILGSRVETDIPESRILNEFQQQTMAANANAAVADSSRHLLQENP